MFDTIYLHAGLPKTGSSYLQDSLQALSQAGLLERVAYPLSRDRPGLGNGSALAAELLFTNPAPTSTARLQAAVQDIVQPHLGSTRSLLISSEDLCYADVEKFSRLKQVLLTYAKSVTLLVAVRPLKAWSYSVYLQLVKAHAVAADYDAAWLQSHLGDFLFYFQHLDRFDVDTVVFRYQDHDLLRAFLGLIGENESLASQVPEAVVNRSLSVDELRVLRAVNGVFADQAIGRKVSAALMRQRPQAPRAQFPAQRETDFQQFAATLSQQLEQFPGPVLERVKAILFDPAAPETLIQAPLNPAQSSLLSAAEVDVALHALRGILDANAQDANAYRKLAAYASGLTPTADSFDPIHYLLLNPDVLHHGVDPRLHYDHNGQQEGRASYCKPG